MTKQYSNLISRRQAQVLDRLCEGLTNKEAARALGITNQTIKNHMTCILSKLHATTRIQAAVAWCQIRPQYVKLWQAGDKNYIPEELPGILQAPDDPCILPSERFWVLVDKETHKAGCWLWLGPSKGHLVPFCNIPGLSPALGHRARRIAYALATGTALPPELTIRMTCSTVLCVCIDHMKIAGLGVRPEFSRPIGKAYSAYMRGETPNP